jgi:hypothetical protein
MLSTILYIILGAVIVGAGIGLIGGLLILIPSCIYLIPYSWHIGGRIVNKVEYKGYRDAMRNATKLYKAWFRREESPF